MKQEAIKQKLYEAQKAQDMLRLAVYRLLLAEVKNKEIELRPQGEEVTEEIITGIINQQVEQRSESVVMYRKAGRVDRAVREEQEMKVLEDLLDE